MQRQAVPLPRELAKEPLPPYVVEPGDVLLIQAVDIDSPLRLPGDQPVLPDGSIDLGRHGRVVVAGHTLEGIEGIVKAAIAAQTKETPAITVRLVNRTSKVYYVLGEVNAPGAYPLIGRETVLDGILTAGGLTDSAARGRVILARPTPACDCRIVLPVCYQEIVQLGDTTTNYQLAPGDRIFVPASCGWFEAISGKKSGVCGKGSKPCPLPGPTCPHSTCQP
jgi:protein involved in polysaccharide export with SLBB domain